MPRPDLENWNRVRGHFDAAPVTLGAHWAYNIINDPKRLAFVLSRYKFAARMIGRGRTVLELGCSEGMGVPILAEFAASYLGVDVDAEALGAARRNWASERVDFLEADILGLDREPRDAVVSLDVVEHVEPEREPLFWEAVFRHTAPGGLCVLGTPNLASAPHASEASRVGHVNLFDGARLRAALGRLFRNVFLFSMNDEVVHTGFEPMAHYLLALACRRREVMLP